MPARPADVALSPASLIFIQMTREKRLFLAVLIAAIFVFIGSVGISRAQGIGIKISPVIIEEIVDPGQIIQRKIQVTNDSPNGRTFYMDVRDFVADGESGQARLIQPGSEPGPFLSSWITKDDKGIDFAAYETKEVVVEVKVPENIGPGGYYGAVLMGVQPPKLKMESTERGAGMSIGQQTACLFLFQVKGDVIEDMAITEFTTGKSMYGTPAKVIFNAKIQNRGNVHGKAIGTIEIKNMFGKPIGEVRFNEKGNNIMPKSTRKYEYDWNHDFGFGKYSATLGLSYGTEAKLGGKGKQSMVSTIEFWIIPWRLILMSLSALIFLATLVFVLFKFYKNKAVKKAMEDMGVGQVKYVMQYQGPNPTAHLAVVILIALIIILLILGIFYFILI